MRHIVLLIPPAILGALLMPAHADPRTDCLTTAPCKVITLSTEEEQALFGPKMVFETAVVARQIDLMGIASYFRDKVKAAPAGDAPKPIDSQGNPALGAGPTNPTGSSVGK